MLITELSVIACLVMFIMSIAVRLWLALRASTNVATTIGHYYLLMFKTANHFKSLNSQPNLSFMPDVLSAYIFL